MKTELTAKEFIESLKEEDFRGSKTKKSLQLKAKYFLNDGNDYDNKTSKGYNVHIALCCLIFEQV